LLVNLQCGIFIFIKEKKNVGANGLNTYFCNPKSEMNWKDCPLYGLSLAYSIKVVRQILILFVEVRILVGQQAKKPLSILEAASFVFTKFVSIFLTAIPG
jgi:hypothetical protein